MLQIEIHSPALEDEVNALIDVGLYADSHALMTEALEKLITTKKDSRLDAAILLYKGIPKTVEIESEDALQTGVSLVKQNHKPNDRSKEA